MCVYPVVDENGKSMPKDGDIKTSHAKGMNIRHMHVFMYIDAYRDVCVCVLVYIHVSVYVRVDRDSLLLSFLDR